MYNSVSAKPVATGLIMACLAGWGNTASATPMLSVHISGLACSDGPASSSTPITRTLTGCQRSQGSVLFTETLSASADYTSLKGFADLLVQIPDSTSLQGGSSASVASWSDSVIVTGGTGSGILRLSYTVTGGIVQGFGGATLQLNGNGSQVFSGVGTFVMDVPMQFGVPVNIGAGLHVFAMPSDLFSVGGPGAFHSIVDFSHTAALLPFVVLDQNLQALSGASVVSSDLSFNYPVSQAASGVPEPATLPLLLLASGLMVFARRAR